MFEGRYYRSILRWPSICETRLGRRWRKQLQANSAPTAPRPSFKSGRAWRRFSPRPHLERCHYNGALIERVCEVCGGREDVTGEPLDSFLKDTYTRGRQQYCGGHRHFMTEGSGRGGLPVTGILMTALPRSLPILLLTRRKRKLLKAIFNGKKSCPYWKGRK